ncbi:MAG TPA: hypothetical protein VFD31_08580 [Thermoleophilaceae bacterium]|nr:hypothetical protein [Thermoleophilaceae bacterium]
MRRHLLDHPGRRGRGVSQRHALPDAGTVEAEGGAQTRRDLGIL